jgi:hypothetical protein
MGITFFLDNIKPTKDDSKQAAILFFLCNDNFFLINFFFSFRKLVRNSDSDNENLQRGEKTPSSSGVLVLLLCCRVSHHRFVESKISFLKKTLVTWLGSFFLGKKLGNI